MTSNSQIESLEQKLADLVQEHARLRQQFRNTFKTIAFIAMICVVSMGAVFQNIGRFQRSVQVEDANTRLRAVLYADDNSGHSGLEIRDPNGNCRASIHTNKNHDPTVELRDINGRVRINIGIDEQGRAGIMFFDLNGNPVRSLP